MNCLSSPPFRVLPRLIRQVSFLTEDSDVTMAVIRKLNYLRSKMLPFSSHEDVSLFLNFVSTYLY